MAPALRVSFKVRLVGEGSPTPPHPLILQVSRAMGWLAASNPLDYCTAVQTVVETPEYLRRIARLIPSDSAAALVLFLAANPTAGKLIEGTGGVRKLRWSRPGMGKSGGARVIYYFYNESIPLFLLTAFAKNEQEDLSQSERNELRKLTDALRASYGGQRG